MNSSEKKNSSHDRIFAPQIMVKYQTYVKYQDSVREMQWHWKIKIIFNLTFLRTYDNWSLIAY